MRFQDAKNRVNERAADYLRPARKKGQFVCPLCGHGSNGDGLCFVPEGRGGNGQRLHCFGCGFHGDLIDLYGREHGLGFAQAFRGLCEVFSIQVDKEVPVAPPRKVDGPGDFMARAREDIERPAARAYLEARGVGIETARKYGLGFVEKWVSPTAIANARAQGKDWTPPASARIIIPTDLGGYTARAVEDSVAPGLRKMKEGPAGLFNPGALFGSGGRPVFVVEGEFDALAVLEAGGLAVALGSVGNKARLVSLLQEKKPSGTLILSLDNDEAGRNASGWLSEALQGLSVPFLVSDIAKGYKDASEAIVGQKTTFAKTVAFFEAKANENPDGVGRYLSTEFQGELERFREGADRRTGFDVLDEAAGGIFPGLYVLGAISSLGKTTFLHQMADQMAGLGQHVIYFSLEQSRLELVSKSIARMAAVRASKACFSSLDIRVGGRGEKRLEGYSEARMAYSELVGDRLTIIQGDFGCNVGAVRGYVERYIGKFGVKPVVIVDYLQILQGEEDFRASVRERMDESVISLKRLSRELEVPVMVVSSVNRANYLAPIDFESFKESGGIEYTADVVWGLQLGVLEDEVFAKEGKLKEKREMIRRAKMEEPRKVELVCLKNRYGVSSYKVGYRYYAGCDWFREEWPEVEDVGTVRR